MMFTRGIQKYFGGAAVLMLLIAAAVLFLPGFMGQSPPPVTDGRDVVNTGSDFDSGERDGTGVAPATIGGDLALALQPAQARGGYTSEPVKADYDFNALGLHWLADMPAGAVIGVEVRFSGDGELWGDWQQVPVDEWELPQHFAETSSAGETIGQLVFTERSRYFQYRLDLAANSAGQSPSVTRLTASYIDAKGYHEAPISVASISRNLGAALSPAEAGASPSIISRAQWGANEAYMTWPAEYAQPKKIVVHHTVTMNNDPDPAATVRSIYYYHAVSLDWGDIGYNYLIDWHGNIYEGRKGGNGVIGAHAHDWNAGTIGISALGNYDVGEISSEMYNAFIHLMTDRSNLNHIDPAGADYFINDIGQPSFVPNYVGHRDVGQTACPGQYMYAHVPQFRAAARANYHYGPEFMNIRPVNDEQSSNSRPLISADVVGSHIVPAQVTMQLDGADVSLSATRTYTYISYRPQQPLAAGTHTVSLAATDSVGSSVAYSWTFNVSADSISPQDYHWSWYDGVSSRNWVLMANPVTAGADSFFELYFAGRYMSLAPFAQTNMQCPGWCGSGWADQGMTITPSYAGIMGGPVAAASVTGAKAIASQRILWGQNSFEEVLGTDAARLSDHYYWTWYDQVSPGYRNWVLVANQNTFPVYYEVRIAGSLVNSGSLPPGGSATPTFAGAMGGPVEAQAWTDSGKGNPADVIASQRVLSDYGSAFNEVSGIPAESLSDHYLWTWYDQRSPGATNWVLVANHNQHQIYYEIKIGGSLAGAGTVAPGGSATPTFPGNIGGPVELQAWTDSGKGTASDVIASQRVVWGRSFEEVPGYPAANLNPSYVWTWYDQVSAGAANWVLVANQNAFPVYYEIKVGSGLAASGTIPAGGSITPTFPGGMGGPVEVRAWTTCEPRQPADIMASQRVLWNGYFNEVPGSVLEDVAGAPTGCQSTTVTSDSSYEVREASGALLTTLAPGQVTSVAYNNGAYVVQTSTGYSHSGNSPPRMTAAGSGIMQVTSYHDIPSWNPSLDDNRFRGTIEINHSANSGTTWIVNELPVESYLRGIAETSSGDPAEYLKTMTVAARSYGLWHLERGGKYGGSEVFHLKNSRNGNGDDQVYKGYGLETRFPDLITAVDGTTGQVVTYNGATAMTPYFSNSDGNTRSALEAWGVDYWPWLQSASDPDCNGMTLNGHGVGISGVGARARAGRGESFTAILGHYYTGISVQPGDTDRNIRIAIAPLP